MQEHELAIKKEMREFSNIRDELYAFFDKTLPKDSSGILFDFSSNPTLDAKELYELFYKYDYQTRKVFGATHNLFNSKK